MKSVYYELLGNGDQLFDTEIISVKIPSEEDPLFRVEFEFWPDRFEYSGERQKAYVQILCDNTSDITLSEELDGYEVRDILVGESGGKLRVDTSIFIIEVSGVDIEYGKLGEYS